MKVKHVGSLYLVGGEYLRRSRISKGFVDEFKNLKEPLGGGGTPPALGEAGRCVS